MPRLGRGARGSALRPALVLTLFDVAKPLVVDDTAYVLLARQIAAHPGDPYGFEIFWRREPEPAIGLLSPPLVPYWIAGAMALAGDAHPALWKLSLLPFALLLAASLRALYARLAPGLEAPLVWLSLLSPALLPAMNLMLDVPALALAAASLVLLLRACDAGGTGLALAAGLVAGAAAQTKYPAVLVLGAGLMHAVAARRARVALVAGAAAAAVFAGWELFLAARYGSSHFLLALARDPYAAVKPPLPWLVGLLSVLGATSPGLLALALTALGAPRRLLVAGAAASFAAVASVALLPRAPVSGIQGELPNLASPAPELFVFVPLGAALAGLATAAVARSRVRGGWASGDALLLSWVALAVAAFFALPPFVAVRRVVSLGVALTAALGRAAARRGAEEVRRGVWIAAGASAATGLLFATADLLDARARRDAVFRTADVLAELGADRARETVWYVGHWGFQFYAERGGMRAAVPGRSEIARGDWLVVPAAVYAQRIDAPPGALVRAATVETRSPWPWSTLPGYYGGAVPIRAQPRAQARVAIFRVREDFVP